MQPVRRDQPASPQTGGVDLVGLLHDVVDPSVHLLHAELERARHQHGMQVGAADAEPGAGTEPRLRGPGRRDVTDAMECASGRVHAELAQPGHRTGHESFTAGLVDGTRARLHDSDRQPRPAGVDRGGQPDRPAAGDEQVPHVAAVASARSSQRIRTVSTTAFTTAKTTAVTHAECTSGSATPSATTAT